MKIYIYIVFALLVYANLSCAKNGGDYKAKAGNSSTTLSKDPSSNENRQAEPQMPVKRFYSYEIIKELPHDTQAYTQGLIYHNGFLYESTGQYRKSSLRKINPNTGEIIKNIKIPDNYFAEGLTIFNSKIYQLTWIENTGFVYDLETLKQVASFSFYGEGWGLTNDDKHLILSDGSNVLRYIEPTSFEVVKTLTVLNENSYPMRNLNELEYVDGYIWANIYMENYIVQIDPKTGRVVSRIDLTPLRDRLTLGPETDVLNGIAYDKEHDVFYFTGKNWNKIFIAKLK